jgi:hypothetical protein
MPIERDLELRVGRRSVDGTIGYPDTARNSYS